MTSKTYLLNIKPSLPHTRPIGDIYIGGSFKCYYVWVACI